MNFAAHQVEVDVAQRCNTGEGFADAFRFKDNGVIGPAIAVAVEGGAERAISGERNRRVMKWKRRASSCP